MFPGTTAEIRVQVEGVEQDYLPVEWVVDGTTYLPVDPNQQLNNPDNVQPVNITTIRTTVS